MRTQISITTVAVARLEKGDRVIIYEDPITRTLPEGVATLVTPRETSMDGEPQHWMVRFDGEREKVYRLISAPWEVIGHPASRPRSVPSVSSCKKS